jgi:hypothetical protein
MTDILIGEVMTRNGVKALYATTRVFEKAIRTDRDYSGLADASERCQALVSAAETAHQSGRTGFSHSVDDGSWTGRPQHIERECLALGLDLTDDGLVVHDRSRRITRDDPAYAAIAAAALKSLENRGQRREA